MEHMTKILREQEINDYGDFLFRSISIAKYNTAYYANEGYSLKEWTSYHDVGGHFLGKKFTLAEYIEVEGRYIQVCKIFVNRFLPETKAISISHFEKIIQAKNELHENDRYLWDTLNKLISGKINFDLNLISQLIEIVLRGYAWFVINLNDDFKIHFGYDYYMYFESISIDLKSNTIVNDILKMDLFVRGIQK